MKKSRESDTDQLKRWKRGSAEDKLNWLASAISFTEEIKKNFRKSRKRTIQ